MNNFYNYYWHDSTIEKIEIFEDNVILSIYNDVLNSQVKITCSRTAGRRTLQKVRLPYSATAVLPQRICPLYAAKTITQAL